MDEKELHNRLKRFGYIIQDDPSTYDPELHEAAKNTAVYQFEMLNEALRELFRPLLELMNKFLDV